MTNKPMPEDDAVLLRNVHFRYGDATASVLQIEELRLPAGRSVFLHGPSGSGKSTLLSIISGILVPQQGSVSVLGQEITRLSAGARDTLRGSSIGYIFQRFSLIPYLSAAENISLPCLLHPARLARIAAPTLGEEVVRMARRLELDVKLNARVTQLSVGQQQRVAIARALIGSPPLVIADEPTSSLDADRREAFLTLLKEMATETAGHDTTLLFVSHDRSLASRFDSSVALADFNRPHDQGAAQP